MKIIGKNLPLCFLTYVAIAFLVSIPLQRTTTLSNWENTFPLILGNERTGDRPWRGLISEAYIADRAISAVEVAQIFDQKELFASIGNSLLASYQLTGIGNYHDKVGNLPNLFWKGEPQNIEQDGGVLLTPNHWLETSTPASFLTKKIIRSSQFTLGATVATSLTTQTGPARIVSLSNDPDHRNFTLGQEGSDLVFRLRTPITGENGTSPQLVVPDVFSSKKPRKLVVTYDGSSLLLYVNGVRTSHTLQLSPGTALFSRLFPLKTFGLVFYKILYYALVFIPLGIMLALMAKKMRTRLVIRILLIFGVILLLSFILEGILVAVSGRIVRLENLLISILFTACPIVLYYYWISKRIQLS